MNALLFLENKVRIKLPQAWAEAPNQARASWHAARHRARSAELGTPLIIEDFQDSNSQQIDRETPTAKAF